MIPLQFDGANYVMIEGGQSFSFAVRDIPQKTRAAKRQTAFDHWNRGRFLIGDDDGMQRNTSCLFPFLPTVLRLALYLSHLALERPNRCVAYYTTHNVVIKCKDCCGSIWSSKENRVSWRKLFL
jgi:hypothetical protein